MRRRSLVAAAALAAAPLSYAAQMLSLLLTVQGRIGRTNAPDGSYRFSESEYLALPAASITTSTVWTPRHRFEGPRLLSVLDHVGATGHLLRFFALDDFSVSIPLPDVEAYDPVLAHSCDGQRMQRDRFGPLWLIFPREAHPDELDGPVARSRFIWQVRGIEVR